MTSPYWTCYEGPWRTGSGLAWDRGITWRTRRTVAPTILPLDVEYLAERVLRVSDVANELAHVEALLWQACEVYESDVDEALMEQTMQQILDRFPDADGPIRLERPPLLAVDSITYVDGDGATQTLTGSPAQFQTLPSGEFSKGEVVPLVGESWPATRTQRDAVTITYRAGYADPEDVPHIIRAGLAVLVGELYKNRELSIAGSIATSPVQLDRFWQRRIFG